VRGIAKNRKAWEAVISYKETLGYRKLRERASKIHRQTKETSKTSLWAHRERGLGLGSSGPHMLLWGLADVEAELKPRYGKWGQSLEQAEGEAPGKPKMVEDGGSLSEKIFEGTGSLPYEEWGRGGGWLHPRVPLALRWDLHKNDEKGVKRRGGGRLE